MSNHEDAIARRHICRFVRLHVDGGVAVLYKEVRIAFFEVGDSSFEIDGKSKTGLGIRESVNGRK